MTACGLAAFQRQFLLHAVAVLFTLRALNTHAASLLLPVPALYALYASAGGVARGVTAYVACAATTL
jgi:hypothetical protein